jgi:hypothetical protein
LAAPEHADGPEALGVFGSWRAFKANEQGQPVCYMTLTTRFADKGKFHRGDAMLTITHRPREGSKDVLSYMPGYNFKPMSDVDLRVGKASYDLFTTQDTAWSRDAATDHKIAAALRTASTVTITGRPGKKGVAAQTDKFVLKGAGEAYHAIGKACGVAPDAKTNAKVKKIKSAKSH